MTAVGADPGVYEAWLGEATELMLDQAGVGPGSRVLDVAAGAGGQTLIAARRTGPDGILPATDISESLVERVRIDALAEGVSHIYATVADAEQLDSAPGAFDAAICRLGLSFLPDVPTALRGIRMALRLGGRFSAIAYDEPRHNPVLASIAGTDEPFRLSPSGVLRAVLEEAGFSDVEVEHVDAPVYLPDDVCVPFRLLVGAGGGPEASARTRTWPALKLLSSSEVSASEASALFDVVGEGAPVGLALVDTELRFVRINSALCAINGRPRELHIGRRIDEVLPEMASVLVPIYQHVLESGEAVLERELTAEQPGTGHVRHVLASWFPVRVDGEVAGVGAVVIDVTDLKAAEMRLEGVLRQLPVGVVIADAAGRVLLTNGRLGEMGMSVAPSGTRLAEADFDAWHADGRPYRREEWPLARSLTRGEIVRGEEMEFSGVDGSRRVLEANSAPIRDGAGTIVAAVVVVQDVTARRQATQRQDLLVRAGEVLDSALGVDERLDRFARLLVPELADFVKIELLEGKEGRRPVAIAHQDPEREALMRAWRERGTLAASERVGMGTTMATGEAKLTTEILPDAVVRSARETTGEEGAELMRAIGPRSQIVVPLRARGRVLGALSLTMADSGRHYEEADLDLARDLGLRAGLAVDNARLYEEAQAAAVAEQRRAETLDALAAASLAIHRTRRLETRLELIAERARELVGSRFAQATIRPGRADELNARAGEAGGDERLSRPLTARDGDEIGRIEVAGKLEGDFTPTDGQVLEDLARIASLAIENARLEERERYIARTLQDSLLPREMPKIEGLEVAARYLAGGEGTTVGGDLYDLFPVEDDWVLVVGDVCGKGAEAAALTGMVRYTLRAESVHHSSPCEVLRLLNDAIIRQLGDGRFCTVLYGRVTVGDGRARLVLASAGHPPPLVVRADGRVEQVPAVGPLLGVVPAVVHPDVIVTLGPGDALVGFTDGVTEGRGPDGMFGDERLAGLLRESAGADAGTLVDRIVDAAVEFQGGSSQDDLAVLALRVPTA